MGTQDSAVVSIALILAWLLEGGNADWQRALLQIPVFGRNSYWSRAW